MFDFTKCSDDLTFHDVKNKKVIGKMKGETKDVVFADFVRLKSEMHSYVKEDNEGEENAKKIYIKMNFFYFRKIRHKMKRIQSKSYQLSRICEVHKVFIIF